jgi:hypothetical protein
MHKQLWFARAVAVYGVLIFSFLAYLYLAEPLKHIERFGIASNGVPESIAFLRVGPGAMFLFLAITSLYGLVRPQMLRASMIILVVFNACVVGARLYGIAHDGVSPLQLTELRDEGISWLLFVVALLALRGMPLRSRSGSGGWH